MKTATGAALMTALLLVACEEDVGENDSNDEGEIEESNFNLMVYEATNAASSVPAKRVQATDRNDSSYFTIWSAREDVFRLLGDPDVIFYGDTTYTPGSDYTADAYHVYMEVGLSFLIIADKVTEITLLNDNWMASNGLIVGMTVSQMTDILGNDYKLVPASIKDFYNYDQYDISVEVYHHDDLVGEIGIGEGNRK